MHRKELNIIKTFGKLKETRRNIDITFDTQNKPVKGPTEKIFDCNQSPEIYELNI